MNKPKPETKAGPPFTSADWDKLRFLMQDSVLADTSLAKLAQDTDSKWPIRGRKETPRKYIGHSLEELCELPEFYGKGNRLVLLYRILEEIQSFDDPFRNMVDQFDALVSEEDEARKALRQLEIPADFPLELANFSPETMDLCGAEDIHRLDQLIDFSRRCARTVLLGGEFQRFLNALLQMDIVSLSRFLPVREGESGIFLAESLGHLAGRLPDEYAATLLRAYRISTAKAAWNEVKCLPRSEIPCLFAEIKSVVGRHFALMPDQAQLLRHAVETSQSDCVRFFAPLNNPDIEDLALALAMAALEIKPRAKGFLDRLINR